MGISMSGLSSKGISPKQSRGGNRQNIVIPLSKNNGMGVVEEGMILNMEALEINSSNKSDV